MNKKVMKLTQVTGCVSNFLCKFKSFYRTVVFESFKKFLSVKYLLR